MYPHLDRVATGSFYASLCPSASSATSLIHVGVRAPQTAGLPPFGGTPLENINA